MASSTAGMAPGQGGARDLISELDGTGGGGPRVDVQVQTQSRCSLAWNAAGDRLLGVGKSTGTCIWAVGDSPQACQVANVATGGVHSKVNCGIFVSSSAVIATAGKRSEADSSGIVKAWPHTCAGLCLWDTLLPPSAALVAHDGAADGGLGAMPAEYTCMAWEADRQRILCGTATGELRIFDIRQRRVSQRLQTHSDDPVKHIFVLPSTGRLATLSAASELKVWSLSGFECLETFPKLHQGGRNLLGKGEALVYATMLSDQHVVTAGQDNVVLLTRL